MRLSSFLSIVVVLCCCFACVEEPTSPPDEQEVVEPAPQTNSRDTFDYDGFYEDYLNTERVVWQRPNLIIGLLGNGDLTNKTIADIGAGSGFFAVRVTPAAGKVIALDINQNFLDIIDSTKVADLPAEYQDRLETRLTPRDAPKLEPNEVDGVLIVNTFMYIDDKLAYLKKLKPCLKDTGRLVIVDFKRKRTKLGPLPRERRLPLYEIEDMLYQAGYSNIQTIDTELNYQYIVIAEK